MTNGQPADNAEDDRPSVEDIAAMLDRMSRFQIAEQARTDQTMAARRDAAGS